MMGDDTDSQLRPWAASWYPGHGYRMETSTLPLGPATPEIPSEALDEPVSSSLQVSGSEELPLAGRGMFTHVPPSRRCAGLTVPPWGQAFGPRETREAWVDRDLVGELILIRVVRDRTQGPSWYQLTHPDPTTPTLPSLDFYHDLEDILPDWLEYHGVCHHDQVIHLQSWDPEPPVTRWLFAYVSGYYQGQHHLVFRFHGVDWPGFQVDLSRCVFQHWTRPDIRRYLAKQSSLG